MVSGEYDPRISPTGCNLVRSLLVKLVGAHFQLRRKIAIFVFGWV